MSRKRRCLANKLAVVAVICVLAPVACRDADGRSGAPEVGEPAESCAPEINEAVLNRLASRYYPLATCDERTTQAQIACWESDLKTVRLWAATLKSACVAGQYNEWLNYYDGKLADCREAVATKKAPDTYEDERKRKEAAQAAWEARHPIPTPPVAEPCAQP